jgi:hypothetical protein
MAIFSSYSMLIYVAERASLSNIIIIKQYIVKEANMLFIYHIVESRDSSVGIELGYGLDGRGSRVRFPAGAGNFSLHHRVQNGPGAPPASYSLGTNGSFPGSKAAGA